MIDLHVRNIVKFDFDSRSTNESLFVSIFYIMVAVDRRSLYESLVPYYVLVRNESPRIIPLDSDIGENASISSYRPMTLTHYSTMATTADASTTPLCRTRRASASELSIVTLMDCFSCHGHMYSRGST